MSDLFNTGIRPTVDAYIQTRAAEKRNYGRYWGASSAGYCMRLNILRRLDIPSVPEMENDRNRTQRVFDVGHIFHEWMQRITKEAGLSIAQELELVDDDLLVKGHIDDLVLVDDKLMLLDYKTANSQSFNYKKDQIGDYHRMQLGTYMYMLNKSTKKAMMGYHLEEGRILTISKDDLRMREQQLLWSPQIEKDIVGYWKTLQGYWDKKTLPRCTCLEHDGGFMGRRSKKGKVYNPYFLHDIPCSEEWFKDKLPTGWKV